MTDPLDLKNLLFDGMGFKPGECNGKVVVITGAGQGIGLQAARGFAFLGAVVVIAEISKDAGIAAESLICAEGGKAVFIHTDVSDSKSVHHLFHAVESTFSQVDILINNAIRCPSVSVTEMDETLWDEVMAVNLKGTFLVSKVFLPSMLERQQGIIVNMVSTDAMPGLSAYIASKQGILGFSQTLALEAGSSGVKVIPFAPGMVDTPGIRGVAADLAPRLGLTQDQFMHISLHTAYGGLMPPEHAGLATIYLALRMADEFHGQMVNGYEVLEQAGLIKSSLPPVVQTVIQTAVQAETKASPFPATGLITQIEKVMEIVATTGKEFEKLPLFVRPIARSGFKSKSGQSLESWHHSLAGFMQGLTEDNLGMLISIIPGLEKLSDYYKGVPHETARFTRDQEMLRQVTEISEQRVADIQQLKAMIITANKK